jgi:uncharacterized protein (TIGR01777 family)
MRVVVAGGTGFLGSPLVASLARDGHEVVVLTRGSQGARDSQPGRVSFLPWTPNGEAGSWKSAVDGAGGVVNLAGEPIAGKRWSQEQKQRILESRVLATRSLVAAIRDVATAPQVFVSGSAVGYYGPLADQIVAEDARPGSDFLARVCVEWEREAASAGNRTRLVCVRTGLVLEKDGGALPEMLPPFKFFVGGPVGTGRQYWPWIHRDDWLGLVRWAIATTSVTGALNATAPNPVTNAEFAHALGRALHRPAFMPAPAFALRMMLGEMADGLLLSGQRAVPAKATDTGFAFKYQRVDEALQAIFAPHG